MAGIVARFAPRDRVDGLLYMVSVNKLRGATVGFTPRPVAVR
jgi:hypothetical protein